MAVHGAHEPVDRVQIDTRVGVDPAAREVEHAAAADRGQLMPVADQRNPGTGLIRDGQQRAGGVLIQHPCLIDKQQNPRAKPGFLTPAAIHRAGDRIDIARL
jgi:hypothetical protein